MKRLTLLATTVGLGITAGPAFAFDDGIGHGEDSVWTECGTLCMQQQMGPDDGNRHDRDMRGPSERTERSAGFAAARSDTGDSDLGNEIGEAADEAGDAIGNAAGEVGDAIGDAFD